MVFKGNIEKLTLDNNYYRKVLDTNKKMQLVLMSLDIDEEIGEEVHKTISQFIRVEKGTATAIIKGKRYYLKDGDSVIVPPNTKHNIINRGEGQLKLYTIYTPPKHSKNCVQKFKADEEC